MSAEPLVDHAPVPYNEDPVPADFISRDSHTMRGTKQPRAGTTSKVEHSLEISARPGGSRKHKWGPSSGLHRAKVAEPTRDAE